MSELQTRLPESFATLVYDPALDELFISEGRKLARAVKARRGRRLLRMLQELRERGTSPEMLAFYRRTVFETFLAELAKPPRGNTHGRVKHSPADGREQEQ